MASPPHTRGYPVAFVCKGGRLARTRFKRSPRDAWVLERGKSHSAMYAIRFWPSKKGWRLCEMRNAQSFLISGKRYSKWHNFSWSDRVYPSEDAAVMHALAILNIQPQLL